jgi:AraC-like DNA-binding protein
VLRRRIKEDKGIIIPSDFYFEIASQLLQSQMDIRKNINSISRERPGTREEIFRRVEIAKDFIHDNLNKKFSLDELAGISLMSKYHLIRSFKEVYGITPHRFYLREKMRLAGEIIRNRSQNLMEIALSLGYPDLPSFSKQFRKFYRTSPSRWSEK